MCALFEEGHFDNGLLLGDKGYACRCYLLTPFLNPRTPAEVAYNEAHAATENTIERCFGVLKRRFPVLSMGMRLAVNTTLAVVVACAVLHNIAIERDDEAPDGDNDINLDADDVVGANEAAGNTAIRRAIVNNYFTQ